MRWPADMYAALERPTPTQQKPSIDWGLMSLLIILIAFVSVAATYVSHASTRVPAVNLGQPSAELHAKLNAQVKANLVPLTTVDSGRVAALEVRPGEPFTKDTVLVRLDDTSHHQALTEAQRGLQQAQRDLQAEEAWSAREDQKIGAAIERLSARFLGCDADIQAALAKAKRWEQEQERMQGFKKPHFELQREMDEVQMQHALAVAEVARAKARKLEVERELAAAHIDLESPSIRTRIVEQIREKIALAKERVASAQAAIERSVVRAPTDGRVFEYLCDSGSEVRPGDRLLALQADEEVWLEAWATEEETADLRVGDEVDVELNTEPVKTLVGRVEKVTEDADFNLNAQQTKLLRLLGRAQIPTRVLTISLPEGQTGLTAGVAASIQKRGASVLGSKDDNELFAVTDAP